MMVLPAPGSSASRNRRQGETGAGSALKTDHRIGAGIGDPDVGGIERERGRLAAGEDW